MRLPRAQVEKLMGTGAPTGLSPSTSPAPSPSTTSAPASLARPLSPLRPPHLRRRLKPPSRRRHAAHSRQLRPRHQARAHRLRWRGGGGESSNPHKTADGLMSTTVAAAATKARELRRCCLLWTNLMTPAMCVVLVKRQNYHNHGLIVSN